MPSVEAHRALVERLEREAAAFPLRYQWKVALLAALGFAVLGGAVLGAFGLSAGLIVALAAISPVLLLKLAKVLWIPVAIGWVVLRSLWISFPPPDGERVSPTQAPMLHAEIERLRKGAGAPRLAGVVVDSDFNAAAASVPRAMGLLGHRHYLVLGLPLMQALSREQFLAVLAHEFGHFGGGHGRFAGWVYHVRLSWFRLLQALSEQGGWFARRFAAFFDWYAPYFNAYSFVLSRANEYQADATASRLVSSAAMAEALVRTQLASQKLAREFWPGIDALTRSHPSPPDALYGQMRSCLYMNDADGTGDGLSRAMAVCSDLDDTHPSLAQRLAALGQPAQSVAPPSLPASDSLLGVELASRLEDTLSQRWQSLVQEDWRERHGEHGRAVERLTELRARDMIDPEEAVERARLQEQLEPDTDPVVLYRETLLHAPDSALAHYRLGLALLERQDHAGVACLERALELEPDAGDVVLDQLAAYYRSIRDDAGMRDVEERLRRLYKDRTREAYARDDLGMRDVFEPHALPADVIHHARAAFASVPTVAKAWIVRKRLPPTASGTPHFVVLVQWRGFVFNEERTLRAVLDGLDLPGTIIVVSPRNRRWVSHRIRKTAGAASYRRGHADT